MAESDRVGECYRKILGFVNNCSAHLSDDECKVLRHRLLGGITTATLQQENLELRRVYKK
jgi:hypothetical protein